MARLFARLLPALAGFYIPPLLAQQLLDISLGYSPIAVDRTAAPAIYAGPFRSLDGGSTWSAYYLTAPGLPQPALYALAVDPDQPSTVYYATDAEQGGVWKSLNQGSTWSKANSGLPVSGGKIEEFFAALVPPYALYARLGDKVYRSTDRAKSWTVQSTLPGAGGIYRIAFRNPSVQFYVRTGVVWRSLDEGTSWEVAGSIPIGPEGGAQLLNSIVDLAVDGGSTSVLYAAERGGWFALGDKYYYSGTWRSLDGGSTWTFSKSGGPKWILPDPAGGPNVFCGSLETSAIQKSGNRGADWKTVLIFQGSMLGGTRLAIADTNPRTVYAATPQGVYLSTDEGETWRPLRGTVRATIEIPSQGLQLQVAAGAETEQTLRVKVLEQATWKVPFTVAVEGGNWLRVSPASGTTPADLTVRASAAGLTPGTYKAAIRLESPDTAHGPVTIPVELTVVAADSGPAYYISTVAGIGSEYPTVGDGGPAVRASILSPFGAAPGSSGRLFIADTDHNRVRMVTADGLIQTVAGTGEAGLSGDAGPATAAKLNHPYRVLPDPAGGFYIADRDNDRVRKVDASGTIRSITDKIKRPVGLALDGQGNLYVASWSDAVISRISPGGTVTAIVGPNNDRRLQYPYGIAVDSSGTLYVTASGTDCVYKWAGGTLTVIAGTGTAGYNGDNQAAKQAMLNSPTDVSLDSAGNIYIADFLNNRIRLVDSTGMIRTIAGTGVAGSTGDGGLAREARVNHPAQAAPDAACNIFVTERWNGRIRKLELRRTPVPRIAAGGVVSSASLDARFAPGSLISVLGTNLATRTEKAPEGPWPATLGGARLRINDIDAPLVSARPERLDGQIPYEISPGTASVTVTVEKTDSAQAQIDVQPTAPALLKRDETWAVAINEDGTSNSPEAPAAPTSVITVYLSGIGAVDNLVATGALAPAEPLARPLASSMALVGEEPAEIVAICLTPGFIGLAQASLRLPELSPGEYALTVAIGDAVSNAAMIAVGTR